MLVCTAAGLGMYVPAEDRFPFQENLVYESNPSK